MVFFPLQAALAAVETYHSHGSEAKVNIESVLHTHADHGDHGTSADTSDTSTNSPCEGDHHHCHGHGVTVLSSFTDIEFPPSSLTQATQRDMGYQSHLSSRIERPKWV